MDKAEIRDFHSKLPVGRKGWINSFTEVTNLGGGKFAAEVNVGHRVFKHDGKWHKHILEDKRPDKDCILIRSAKCVVEVYPFYAKYYDMGYTETRLEEERWVVQRLFKEPDTWRDVGAWNPVMSVEENGDVVNVTVTYETDYGPFTVEYFQRDGNPLKHNIVFKNTSGGTETFRVLQRWAGIVGEKCNGKNIPMIFSPPTDTFLAFHRADESPRNFTIAENPRSMIFNPDGSVKTNHCLKGPFWVESHAQGMKCDLCYGDWILDQNEELSIDPDVYSNADPTEDGTVEKSDIIPAGSDCPAARTLCNADTPGRQIGATDLLIGGFCLGVPSTSTGGRSYVEWDITALAGTVLLTNPFFKYEGTNAAATSEEINPLTEEAPTAATNPNLWNYIATGVAYVDPWNLVVAINQSVDLGAAAKADLQAAATAEQSWFAIGLYAPNDECPGSSGNFISSIESEEGPSPAPAPTLYVTYTTPETSKISGVTDPAEVAGVAAANIAKIKGVDFVI